MNNLIEKLRYEAEISDRPRQFDRLNTIADEFAAEIEAQRAKVERLKRFIELELAKITPQWTAEGKGSYWWGVKIGLETALAKLCEMEGQAP